MTFIKVNEQYSIECEQKGNKYSYLLKEGDAEPYLIGSNLKSPLEHSKSSDVGKQVYNILKDTKLPMDTTSDKNQVILKEFSRIMVDLDKELQKKHQEIQKDIQKQEEQKEDDYLKMNARFEKNCEKYNCSPLQLMTRTSEGLGVDIHLQIMQAVIGYLQTYFGYKGTNVIAIGGQSSGKTHCLEMALDMIPEESVHRGVSTLASFFKKNAGKDLTGENYYLGDLGGEKDNENTIAMRDALKQLSTDGLLPRSLVDTNTNEAIDEVITGYPAISYTTVNEDIINEQERSRSVLIYPPTPNQKKMIVFNSFNDAPGNDWELKQRIELDKESIKGFLHELKKKIGTFEMFNVYDFCIQEHLSDMEDFNRKIQEYTRTLLIICILDDAPKIVHSIYKDEEFNDIVTVTFLPTKQNNVDALTIFNKSIGLLPTDISLANGLTKKYAVYQLSDNDDSLDEYLDENVSFEDRVIKEITPKDSIKVSDDSEPIVDWDQCKAVNDKGKELPCFFTVDTLKKHNNQRWYRENRKVLSNKLIKLQEYGLLIKVGKTRDNRNIYGLNDDVKNRIKGVIPKFDDKLIKMGIREFKRKYGVDDDLLVAFEEFIIGEKDAKLGNSFDITKDDHIYDLPWNSIEGVNDD